MESIALSKETSTPWREPIRVAWHLRLYECVQASVPAVAGILASGQPGRAWPLWLAVFSHQVFIYNFNDLCDREEDLVNPRKAFKTTPPIQSLKRGTCALSALVFLAALAALAPLPAAVLLALQLGGMAY